MVTNRRSFFKTSAAAALGSSFFLNACKENSENCSNSACHLKLDDILAAPVLKTEYFTHPVIIEKVELLRYGNNFICRVVSEDGETGLSVSNNMQMISLYPIFINRIQPFFIGKDAVKLEQLLEEVYVYKSNYKLQNLAFWVPLATLEFAILDLLGRIAAKPMGELIGETHNQKIGVYQANNFRGESAEKSLEGIIKNVEETGAKAVKFKVGGRMSTREYPPGRTEKLIPMVREAFGPEMTIYADSNGSYDAKEAIRIGKVLQEYNIDFYEEPVPFDWYEETKEVAGALEIPIAGGEQEPSMRNFRWLIANNALDIVQPDIFYFGGMIRSMKVALMAASMGKSCIPHISGSGLGYLYMMHFVSVLPNAGPYHEFKGFNMEIPFRSDTSDLEIKDGKISVPTGRGLGIEIDLEFIDKHEPVKLK
jgi:L-alanine-DL-glutamate epimerase-like enolase superfamily enzyme